MLHHALVCLTLLATLLHATLGCGWHHAHAQSPGHSACATHASACVAACEHAESCSLHDEAEHGRPAALKPQEKESAPLPVTDRAREAQHGPLHHCLEGKCVVVLSSKTPMPDGDAGFVQVAFDKPERARAHGPAFIRGDLFSLERWRSAPLSCPCGEITQVWLI